MTALGDFSSGDVLTAADLNGIGVWQDFTPTLTGLTIGNGTVTARYCQINKFVAWQVEIVCGSTTTVGDCRITYPVTASDVRLSGNGGQVFFEDNTGADFVGNLYRYNTQEVRIYIMDTATYSYPRVVPISSTIPFSWTTDDRIIIQDFYEAA